MSVPAPSPVSRPPPEPRYQPLVIVLAAAVVGILLDRFWPLPLGVWCFIAMAGLAVWLALFLRHRTRLAGFAVLMAVVAAAGAWHHCRWHLFASDDLGCYARSQAQPVCVEAVARGAPRAIPPLARNPFQTRPPEDCWRLNVDVVGLRNGATWQSVSGRAALLVQGTPPEIAAGDRLRCFGRLSAPSEPRNPGERDRSAYPRADRVRSRLHVKTPECLSVVAMGSPWNLTRLLDRLRAHGNRMFEQYLDPRQAELASAVLLGLREELDRTRTDAFFTTGTVHILCISGLHVGILAGAMFWILRRTPLPRGWVAVIIGLTTLLYALMVDARPSVVRATVLVLVACAAMYSGRRAIGINSLAAAALVVLAINPAHLFHVGAQLSFLCVAGLIWCAPWRPHGDDDEVKRADRTIDRLVMQNLGWLPWLWVKFRRAAIGLTLAGVLLWLLTSPLVMARFHILSPVALVLNVFVWIPMLLSVLSGFGVLLCGTICPPLGYLCGRLCNASFLVLESIIDWARHVPHYWVSGPADWWLWGFYGALGLLLAFPRLRPSRTKCAALLLVWIAVGFTAAVWPHPRDRLDCTFLSVGHGCAVLLELPSGQTMLYDAGQFGAPSAGERTISECLWHRGVTHLDAVVLSHPDIDHYNALPGLLEKFSVGIIYVPPTMFADKSRAVTALRDAIDAHGVPIRQVERGDRIDESDGCAVEVLHAPRCGASGSDNAHSVVLTVEYLGRRILLPGDLEPPGLDDLLAEAPRPCDVLLAPHHGSRKSNSPELAAWCGPRWVVFSGDGRWSLPEIEIPYRAADAEVLHTHESGAIQMRIDAAGVQVRPFVESPRLPQ